MNDAALKSGTHEIVVDEVFPHAPETIWKTLTNGALMARWLRMTPTGFEAVKGKQFTYQTTPGGAWDGVIHCEVLEAAVNERLVYSWKSSAEIHWRRRAGFFRSRDGHRVTPATLRSAPSPPPGPEAHLDQARRQQGLPPLPFGVALHLGEMLWGNIGAADRLDFTAIGSAVNLVSRLEGLCRPLDKVVLVSETFAAAAGVSLIALGTHALRGYRISVRRLHRAGELSRRVDRS